MSTTGNDFTGTSILKPLVAMLAIWIMAVTAIASDRGDLRFTEEEVDFGCVGIDFKLRHIYQLVNHSKETIHIDTVTPHCDCTEVRFRDSTVGPGDTVSFLMIFNTADFYGPIEKDIRVVHGGENLTRIYTYYRANIAQWLFKVEPRPVSIFMLPGQKTKTSTLFNHALDKISLIDFTLVDDICQIEVIRSAADKGESIAFEITPNADLTPGTHTSNFTARINLHQDLEPLSITIPVKIVKY